MQVEYQKYLRNFPQRYAAALQADDDLHSWRIAVEVTSDFPGANPSRKPCARARRKHQACDDRRREEAGSAARPPDRRRDQASNSNWLVRPTTGNPHSVRWDRLRG